MRDESHLWCIECDSLRVLHECVHTCIDVDFL